MARKADTWIEANIPSLEGKTAVVTGANTGIGFEVARGLAMRGAGVVLACRDEEKGLRAANKIAAKASSSEVRVCNLDLANRTSIAEAADELTSRGPIDILVNNAGVGLVRKLTYAREGFWHKNKPFELQLATNYLGHFALTGLLMPSLLRSPAGRIVNVTSSGHRYVNEAPYGFTWTEQDYDMTTPYNYSKLAQLQATLAHKRRLPEGSPLTIAAAQPGMCTTGFFRHLPIVGNTLAFSARAVGFAQSAKMGALPVLLAAAGNNVKSGDLYSPDGFKELAGWPTKVEPSNLAKDIEAQDALWRFSEQVTGVHY